MLQHLYQEYYRFHTFGRQWQTEAAYKPEISACRTRDWNVRDYEKYELSKRSKLLNEEHVSSYSSVTLSSPLCLRALLFLKFNSNYSKVSEERDRESISSSSRDGAQWHHVNVNRPVRISQGLLWLKYSRLTQQYNWLWDKAL